MCDVVRCVCVSLCSTAAAMFRLALTEHSTLPPSFLPAFPLPPQLSGWGYRAVPVSVVSGAGLGELTAALAGRVMSRRTKRMRGSSARAVRARSSNVSLPAPDGPTTNTNIGAS